MRHAAGEADVGLPVLPSRAIQEQFVGSALGPAFEEAFAFYSTFSSYAAALAMPFDQSDAKFLDFGCGWGRFLRYAMNDFEFDQLFAVDIDPSIIASCLDARLPARFSVIEPRGTLPFPDNHFSHAMAYSVFTHLPEDVHLRWSAEIIRVLKPGGVFCGTIETRKFLEFIKTLGAPEECPNDWYKALATYGPRVDEFMAQYEAGSFVYLPTGGGGIRTSDVYGDAVISPKYIEKNWAGVHVRAVIDENFWQTVFVVQKA